MTLCPICYNDKKLSHSCSNSNCDKDICNDCYNNWIVEMENKNCPFCTLVYHQESKFNKLFSNSSIINFILLHIYICTVYLLYNTFIVNLAEKMEYSTFDYIQDKIDIIYDLTTEIFYTIIDFLDSESEPIVFVKEKSTFTKFESSIKTIRFPEIDIYEMNKFMEKIFLENSKELIEHKLVFSDTPTSFLDIIFRWTLDFVLFIRIPIIIVSIVLFIKYR